MSHWCAVCTAIRCFLTPGLVKADKEAAASLPLIISSAGGQVVSHLEGSEAEETFVLGVPGDKGAWAKRNLPAGKAVYSKEALKTAIIRAQRLDSDVKNIMFRA